MNTLLNEEIDECIREEYTRLWSGDKESLASLPVESLLPILLLKNLGSLSTTFDLNSEVLEYGFDPDIAFGKKMSAKK